VEKLKDELQNRMAVVKQGPGIAKSFAKEVRLSLRDLAVRYSAAFDVADWNEEEKWLGWRSLIFSQYSLFLSYALRAFAFPHVSNTRHHHSV